MANNLGYTPGAGATIASDDISGVHYQRMKIGLGAEDTAVDWQGIDGFKTAAASPDGGLAAVALADRRYTSVNLGTVVGNTQAWDPMGAQSVLLYIGTTTTGTFIIEVSPDGTNYISANAFNVGAEGDVTGTNITPTSGTIYRVLTTGYRSVRVRTVTTLGGAVSVIANMASGQALLFPQGNVAHDSVDAGNPLKFGGYGKSSAPTNVADGDRVNAWLSQFGALNVILRDTSGAAVAPGVQYVRDVAAGTAQGTAIMLQASTAVPGAVSADGDAVTAWGNRTGAQVIVMAPHIGMIADPWSLTFKTAQYTTTQTGVALWTPAGGKKLVIVAYQVQAGGTTAGTFQLWFGASGDTTYSRGTDLAIFDGEFAPSATLKPGVVQSGVWIASAADHILRVTDSAAINPLTVTVWGYEV